MSSIAVAIALALALQGSLCTPLCAESSGADAALTAAVAESESAPPCHETTAANSPESSGTSGCGPDCEGCGLFAQAFSGAAKPAVTAAPALFLRIPVSQIEAPQQPRIDLCWLPNFRKRSLPILHSSLLL